MAKEPIMIRCRYEFCGKWFETTRHYSKFCSKECGRRHHNELKSKEKHPGDWRCPFCQRYFTLLRNNQGTCGSPECLEKLAKKREQSKAQYHAGKPELEPKYYRRGKKVLDVSEFSGYIGCMDCQEKFWTSDRRKYRRCPSCDAIADRKLHQHRFVPEGW